MTEEEINQLKIKAENWDKLKQQVADFYDENESEDPEISGGLVTLGEILASTFGYL